MKNLKVNWALILAFVLALTGLKVYYDSKAGEMYRQNIESSIEGYEELYHELLSEGEEISANLATPRGPESGPVK